MSSKCLLEPCSVNKAEDSRRSNRLAGELMGKELGAEWVPSPVKGGKEEVSSKAGQEQSQNGGGTKIVSRTHQASQCDKPVTCMMTRHHRRPKLGSKLSCTHGNRVMMRTHLLEPQRTGPFYFVGGTNGAEIVSEYFDRKGWKRIYDKQREDFKLKWCETKSLIDFRNFREGEQLIYQLPNNKVLTSKIGLLSSLREFERVTSKVNHGQGVRRLKMEEFVPTTFRLDVKEELETFFSQQEDVSNNDSHMWICKPTGLNQGKGIFLLRDQEDLAAFRLKLQQMQSPESNKRVHHRRPQAHIVQHYIENPLLLRGKKFDVRSYLLIACTAPYMIFFRHGYVRLTCDLYDPSSNNLSAHLTNQYMQKKNPLYSQLKEDTVWSMERFNTYVNDRFQVAKGLPRDWVLGTFAKRMQQIMTQCFMAVKSKLVCPLGFFDLIGCDFMVDENFKVWLLEMNCNPALHTNCEVLKEVIPSTVSETLDLTLEIFNKCRLRQKIFPLTNQREFMLLCDGSTTDSLLMCRKNHANAELNQKPKSTESRRCRSAMEGQSVTWPSSDNLGRVGTSRSDSDHHSTTITSPFAPVKEHSHFCYRHSTESIRGRCTRSPRVELKPSICTLHHELKPAAQPKRLQAMHTLKSLSSPALSQQNFIPHETGFPEKELKKYTESSVCETKEGMLKIVNIQLPLSNH